MRILFEDFGGGEDEAGNELADGGGEGVGDGSRKRRASREDRFAAFVGEEECSCFGAGGGSIRSCRKDSHRLIRNW